LPLAVLVTVTTIESTCAVPGVALTVTLIWPATTAGGIGTGPFRPSGPAVIDAIETEAGTFTDAGLTTIVVQPLAEPAPVAVAVAQTEVPGDEARPLIVADVPDDETIDTFVASPVDHVTTGVMPLPAVTAAVRLIWSLMFKVAPDGETLRPVICAGVVCDGVLNTAITQGACRFGSVRHETSVFYLIVRFHSPGKQHSPLRFDAAA
jgi:hypothetical protein